MPRLLVLSNLFPPKYLGGYELACADVVAGLQRRGWRVSVLTSWSGHRRPSLEPGVFRLLKAHMPWDGTIARTSSTAWSLWNRTVLQFAVNVTTPHAIQVFNPSGLGGLVLDHMHSQRRPIIHDVSDSALIHALGSDAWFSFSAAPAATTFKQYGKAGLLRLGRPLLPPVAASLNLNKSYFRSRFLRAQYRDAGIDVGNAPVIHHGVRLTDYRRAADSSGRDGVLYAGRISPEKGVDVLLDALALLQNDPVMLGRRITLAGARPNQDYWELIQRKSIALRRVMRLELLGQIPRAKMPELLGSHSLYVLPAVWEEPFSIGLLEAMAAGLAIIATNTGGSSEILKDGDNCLVVPTGDASALADAMRRVLSDHSLLHRIARGGRETIGEFDLETSIQRIDEHLERAVNC